MGPNELNVWIDTIPYESEDLCNCQKHIYTIVAENPPRFDDWERWTWEVHNVVNRKLGKPEIAWEEACLLWGWDTTKETQ
jgi:hypothetical protein